MTHLILGSKSPQRREILSYFSLPFEQVESFFDEGTIPFTGNPEEYANRISRGKAGALIDRFPNEYILTADSIVYCKGKVYGKPKDEEDAFQTLLQLAGNWHSVFTGVTVRHQDKEYEQCEETRVLFNPLTESDIRRYHDKLHWGEKAGGYDIRMAGGLVVNRIEGCFYNVVGLPINTVRKLLLEVKIDLWNYLK